MKPFSHFNGDFNISFNFQRKQTVKQKVLSVVSTDSLVESTTSELGHSKSSNEFGGGTSEVSGQCTPSISIESNNSVTNQFIDRVIDVKIVDFDNNNEIFIGHGNQEGGFI